MTITINNAAIQSREQLPDNIQTILQLTPQAQSWFDVMRHDPDNAMVFSSNDEFVEQLIPGLHGTSLVYIANMGLFIGAKKLLEFSDNEIRDLYCWEQFLAPLASSAVSNEQVAGVKSLLDKHRLVNNELLQKIDQFYQLYSISPNPLTWGASFHDQLVLYDILLYTEQNWPTDHAVAVSAINWAMEKSQSLSEFAHYYCIYLAWASQAPTTATATAPIISIDSLVEQLTPLVEQNLDCPVVTHELGQHALNSAITQWGEQNKTLGFTDFSSGLLNLILNIDLSQPGTAATQAKAYMASLQQQLQVNLAVDAYVNQPGSYLLYCYDLPTSLAVINLDEVGCLSLYSDRPKATVKPDLKPKELS